MPIDEYLEQCAALGCLPDALLIDAHKPGEYGGTGETADWEAIARWRDKKQFDIPLVLAGGLTPYNVAEAIQIVRPDAVDTASGVEISPGRKGSELVRAFVAEAKRAFAAIA
jgi:phosphoribosylanthranilate isomerase